MVPEIVEPALLSREIVSLQVQRMPKKSNERFSNPLDAPYLTVVTPSTHDMSTIREWWA
jgi:4-alpha-glucanotransferase